MAIGTSDRILRYRDMARQEEEEVGLLPPESDIDENESKSRRNRGICAFRSRYRQVFITMLCFVITGLAALGISKA